MTKKEVIWLLIRLAGLYFLWQCVASLFGVLSTLTISQASLDFLARSSGLLLTSALLMLVYLALGLYLLTNGELLFFWLNREPDSYED